MPFWRKNQLPVDGRTVVVTGGSQGLGKAAAEIFASKGANVVIIARDIQKLEQALDEIRAASVRPTQRFHCISANVTLPSENTRIIAEVTAWNNGTPPDVVWANAGFAIPALFLDTSIETLHAQMDINYWSAVYLARATFIAWLRSAATNENDKQRASSRLPPRYFITSATTATFIGAAGYTPYSPAKSALRSFHDTMRSELNLYNALGSPEIRIATVFPGTIITPGLTVEAETKHPITDILEAADPHSTSEQVAETAIRKLEKGHRMITTRFLGLAMRAGAMQGSVRDSWLVDTVLGWVVGFAHVFAAPHMERKVRRWARENGSPTHAEVDV